MLSCSAFFLKMNDNFLVFFLSELPNLWQASISPISVTTSISARILITVSSKLSSVASSGMPQITVLFCCSYCSDSGKIHYWPTYLQDSYISDRFLFNFKSLLMTVSFMLMTSSLRLLIFVNMLYSNFANISPFITDVCFLIMLVLNLV